LQVVDIPNRTPYQHALACKAEDNLHQFLFPPFLQAQVQAQSQIDEAHMLANVCCRRSREAGEVGNVEIQGPEAGEADRLLRATRTLRATLPVSLSNLASRIPQNESILASSAIKRDLAKQNHLASKVRLDHPDYHQDSNRVDLVIDVRPGPIVKVRVTARSFRRFPFLRDRQMKKLIPYFPKEPSTLICGRGTAESDRFFSEQRLLQCES